MREQSHVPSALLYLFYLCAASFHIFHVAPITILILTLLLALLRWHHFFTIPLLCHLFFQMMTRWENNFSPPLILRQQGCQQQWQGRRWGECSCRRWTGSGSRGSWSGWDQMGPVWIHFVTKPNPKRWKLPKAGVSGNGFLDSGNESWNWKLHSRFMGPELGIAISPGKQWCHHKGLCSSPPRWEPLYIRVNLRLKLPNSISSSTVTWKQEKKLLKKESKFILDLTMFGVPGNLRSMNLPPNNWTELSCGCFGFPTWVPSRAKMPRKRKRRTSREAIASIEEMRDLSRFCRDFQYRVTCNSGLEQLWDCSDHLESSQQSDAAEHRHSQWRDHIGHCQGHLKDGGDHYKEVKTVEEGDEVEGEAKGVHLEEHLKGEKDDEEKVCGLLELAEPVRLPKVLSCQYLTIIIKCAKKNPNHGVEKDKSDNHPKHCLWLHCTPAFGLHTPEGEGNCSFSSVCWPQSTSAPRYPTQPQYWTHLIWHFYILWMGQM